MNRYEDFWKVTEDSLDKSMKLFKIDTSMKNELLDLYKVLSTFPEVKETLQKLKEKKYKLVILSNGTHALIKELVDTNNLGGIFDDVISVEEVKIYKPHSNVYNIPIKKYQIEKKQFAYLSANTWDVSAAGNFGFNAVWVNRNKNIFDNLDYEPIIEIKNLIDLNNLL
tara:strand:- start:88 stop:591 length:504 start_codon:yes stop_codon:yes gene_type:complete